MSLVAPLLEPLLQAVTDEKIDGLKDGRHDAEVESDGEGGPIKLAAAAIISSVVAGAQDARYPAATRRNAYSMNLRSALRLRTLDKTWSPAFHRM